MDITLRLNEEEAGLVLEGLKARRAALLDAANNAHPECRRILFDLFHQSETLEKKVRSAISLSNRRARKAK